MPSETPCGSEKGVSIQMMAGCFHPLVIDSICDCNWGGTVVPAEKFGTKLCGLWDWAKNQQIGEFAMFGEKKPDPHQLWE